MCSVQPYIKCPLSRAILEIHQQNGKSSPDLCPNNGRCPQRCWRTKQWCNTHLRFIYLFLGFVSVCAVESTCFTSFNNVARKTPVMSYRNSSHLRAPTEQPEPQTVFVVFLSSAFEHFCSSHSKLFVLLADKQHAACTSGRQLS